MEQIDVRPILLHRKRLAAAISTPLPKADITARKKGSKYKAWRRCEDSNDAITIQDFEGRSPPGTRR